MVADVVAMCQAAKEVTQVITRITTASTATKTNETTIQKQNSRDIQVISLVTHFCGCHDKNEVNSRYHQQSKALTCKQEANKNSIEPFRFETVGRSHYRDISHTHTHTDQALQLSFSSNTWSTLTLRLK
eukprot:m.14836 g.14836  ORF g.14836 m.14836 type:complete len:129 (-) comp6443_c0_seq1:3162-3548(-)